MEWIYLLLIILSGYFIAAYIHELGHVIVGLLFGWKLYLIVVGPLGIKREKNGGLKIYFEKNVKFWGGVGGTLPFDESEKNIDIWAKVLLAGPVASIGFGLLSIPVGIFYNSMFFGILGAMSTGMGIASALPFPLKTGIGYIDGYRWKRLKSKTKNEGYWEEVALFRLFEFEQFNKSFQNFDSKYIESLKRSEYSIIHLYGLYAEYKYYLSIGDYINLKTVEVELENVRSKTPKFIFDDFKSKLNESTTAANNM